MAWLPPPPQPREHTELEGGFGGVGEQQEASCSEDSGGGLGFPPTWADGTVPPPEAAGGAAMPGVGRENELKVLLCIGFEVCDILVQTQSLGWEAEGGGCHVGAPQDRCQGEEHVKC